MIRDLHLVIPTIDGRNCEPVIQEALHREPRLARLTVVSQGDQVKAGSAESLAETLGVVYTEMHFPELLGAARARLLGATGTVESFLGFQDDDIRFGTGRLSDLVSACEEQGLGGASAVVEEVNPPHRFHLTAKSFLFRGIFSDPRAVIYRNARTITYSPLLPFGATVYRRDVFEHCAPVLEQYTPSYTWGEDVEVSFCASRSSLLAIVPQVRVTNGRHYQGWSASGGERSLARLQRYTRFADAHVQSRRDRLHFVLVVLGLFVQSLADRVSPSDSLAVLSQVFHRPRSATVGDPVPARQSRHPRRQ